MRYLVIAICFVLTYGFTAASGTTISIEQQASPTAEQYLQAADRYSTEKQYDKAVDYYKLAINLNANLPAAYYGLGVAYVNMGRLPDALEPMRTAVRLAPTNANSHRVLGSILGHLQRFDDGLAEMYEARRLNPNDANIHNDIGNILLDG